MHIYNLDQWRHAHDFAIHDRASERKVLFVVGLTLATMAAEIGAGMLYGSMALLADGFHMGTHAVALGITAVAYYFARKHVRDRRFTFGTGKVGILGGFTSAVVLVVVALLMAVESVQRLLEPNPIRFNEAILVAFLGLAVNLISARLLLKAHSHEHHGDAHHHHDHDHNMRGAYLHVLADALTSVLAIIALSAGKAWNWVWLDPAMGVVGALIIGQWARGLLADAGRILLDRDTGGQVVENIRQLIETDADNRISDLHLWMIGSHQMAAIISLVTHFPRPPEHYKALLSKMENLAHVTIEVIPCTSEPCIPTAVPGY